MPCPSLRWRKFLRVRAVLLLTLVALASTVASVQAESLFSQSFFGRNAFMADARVEGRGGAGLAYQDTLTALVTSPAQLTDLHRVTLSMVIQLGYMDARDRSGQRRHYEFNTPNFGIVLPIGPWFSFGTGFRAQRSTQWTLTRESAASPPDEDPPIQETLQRDGTLFDLPLELGVRVSHHIRLGVGLLVTRGSIRQRWSAAVPSGASPLDTREDVYKAQVPEFAASLLDIGPFSFAGFYVPSRSAKVEIQRRGVSAESNQNSTRTDLLPVRYGVGFRMQLPWHWSIGADHKVTQFPLYQGRETYVNAPLYDELEIRAGLERDGNSRGRDKRWPWRLGGYYRTWHYYLENEPITEFGFTLGTGIPIKTNTSRMDIAIAWGQVGKLGLNGAQESFFRVMLSITGGEKWY